MAVPREQDAALDAGGHIAPGIKVFKASMDGAPSTIDPVQASNVYANFGRAERLRHAVPLQVPGEALRGCGRTSLPAMPEISADGLVYHIRIKPGVHFIDDPAFPGGMGREVVAEDVVYSLKRHFDPSQRPRGAWLWQGRIVGLDAWKAAGSDYDQPVEGLRALDRYTIEIRLIKPYPQLLYTLAQGYSAIVPREAVETYGREFASAPGRLRAVQGDLLRLGAHRLRAEPKFRQEPVDIWRKATTRRRRPSPASRPSRADRRRSSTGWRSLHLRIRGALELVHERQRDPVSDGAGRTG